MLASHVPLAEYQSYYIKRLLCSRACPNRPFRTTFRGAPRPLQNVSSARQVPPDAAAAGRGRVQLFVGRDRRTGRRDGRSPHRAAAALPAAAAGVVAAAAAAHEVREHLDRQREDDGRVLLGRDAVERLQVAQLQRRRRLVDDVRRLAQRLRRSVLALRRNHLRHNVEHPRHRHRHHHWAHMSGPESIESLALVLSLLASTLLFELSVDF